MISLFGISPVTSSPGFSSTSTSFHTQDVRDYFREILLSYRLLFGQDRHSWREFKRDPTLSSNQDGSIKHEASDVDDPLLHRLCGKSWKSEKELFSNLDAPEAPNYYSPSMDFPILSEKLLRLQRFSNEQHPHDLKLLWSDRRDIRKYICPSSILDW